MASYVFELGTDFFQACSVFENTILPNNLNALLYAAKTPRTPYLTPQGPEALNLSLSDSSVPQGMPITLNATLNDTRFNNSQGSEPVDQIAAAEYYIDVPYWITTTLPVAYPMSPADGNFNTSIEGAVATIDTSTLSVGQHIIFVRGQDNDVNAYWGPVSAIFLTVEPPLADQFLTKTASVTEILPGETLTYTLDYQIELTGTHTYTLDLRDALPAGITILTETITLNGTPAPNLYNPDGPALELTQAGGFMDSLTVLLTFQAAANFAPAGTQITNQFTTTLTLDGEPYPEQTSNPATITLLQSGDPWLTLEKTASAPEALPGDTFTYTLAAQVVFTGTHAYTLTLRDLLPAEVTVLTDTILLDGTPAPWLYHPATHAISGTLTGVFTNSGSINVTFQVVPTLTSIKITNVFFSGAGLDEPDEYVEIQNMGTLSTQLQNWTLRDNTKDLHVFTFPSFLIEPGQTCRIYTNEAHPEFCGFNFGNSTAIWNNDGDCALLQDENGNMIDEFCYPLIVKDKSDSIVIINTVVGSAIIDGQTALYGGDASVTITILATLPNKLYLPLIFRQ
ncbi:MAG: hypothetical protein Fur0022_27020 [Anaerolineales bacterium]